MRRHRPEALIINRKGARSMSTMPAFVFARRRDIELECGFTLAGTLIVDIPKRKKLKKNHNEMIQSILNRMTCNTTTLPDYAMAYGWRNGRRPDNADETINNDALMASWAETRRRCSDL